MAVRVESLGGKELLALGLTWDSLASSSDVPLRERIADAASRVAIGAVSGVLWKTKIGFVPSKKVDKAGQAAVGRLSAAAIVCALAEKHSTQLVVIQRLRDGKFWVGSCEADGFTHLNDSVVTLEAAVEYLNSMVGDLKVGFLLTGVRELCEASEPLRALINAERAKEKPRVTEAGLWEVAADEELNFKALRITKRLGTPVAVIFTVFLVVLVLAVVGGAFLWYKQVKAQEQLEAAQRDIAASNAAAAQAKDLREARIQQAILAALKEDSETLSPTLVFSRCYASMAVLGRSLGGWGIDSGKCVASGDKIALTLQLKLGSVGASDGVGTNTSLIEAAAFYKGTVSVATGLRQATAVVPVGAFALRPPVQDVSAFPSMKNVLESVGSTWQYAFASGVDVSLSPASSRSIVFKDPAKEGNPPDKQFEPVPDDRGYSRAEVIFKGTAARQLPGAAFGTEYAWVSPLEVEFRPSDRGPAFTAKASIFVK